MTSGLCNGWQSLMLQAPLLLALLLFLSHTGVLVFPGRFRMCPKLGNLTLAVFSVWNPLPRTLLWLASILRIVSLSVTSSSLIYLYKGANSTLLQPYQPIHCFNLLDGTYIIWHSRYLLVFYLFLNEPGTVPCTYNTFSKYLLSELFGDV